MGIWKGLVKVLQGKPVFEAPEAPALKEPAEKPAAAPQEARPPVADFNINYFKFFYRLGSRFKVW